MPASEKVRLRKPVRDSNKDESLDALERPKVNTHARAAVHPRMPDFYRFMLLFATFYATWTPRRSGVECPRGDP